jgi:hypothetical protein
MPDDDQAVDERVIDPSHTSDDGKAAVPNYSSSVLSRFELRRMALEPPLDLSWEDEEAGGKADVERRTAGW